jgi:Spy/CpxP family protein refolding chaperone
MIEVFEMNRKNTTNPVWTILASMTVLLLAAGAAVAQDAGESGMDRDHAGDKGKRMADREHRRSMGPERMARMMTRRLDLDETQAEQVSNIIASAKPEFDSLREKGKANREAMRALKVADPDYDANLQNLSADQGELATTASELRGRIRAEVHAVLTPEQREKMAAAGERERDHGQRNRHRDQSRDESRSQAQ